MDVFVYSTDPFYTFLYQTNSVFPQISDFKNPDTNPVSIRTGLSSDPKLDRSCEFNFSNQIKTCGVSFPFKYLHCGFINWTLTFDIASVWLTCLVSEEIYCEALKRSVVMKC